MTEIASVHKKKRRRSPKPARRFWAELRADFRAFLLAQLGEPDLATFADLEQRLEVGLRTLVVEITHGVANARDRAFEGSPSRRVMAAACRALAMDPPRRGRLPDLRKAARQKRAMARRYHPDVAGGNRALFEQAIEAYEVIEQYVRAAEAAMPAAAPEGANHGGDDDGDDDK